MSYQTFSIARTSLLTYSQALNIVGQNISNVQNPDYTRQMPVIVTNIAPTSMSTQMEQSLGIKLNDIVRMRSTTFDTYYREENNKLQDFTFKQGLYDQAEYIFNELNSDSVSNKLEEFWKSWQSVQQSSVGLAMKKNVINNAETLAESIRTKASQLTTLKNSITPGLEDELVKINAQIEQLFNINDNITRVGPENSSMKNSYMDRRDKLVDDLRSEMNFQAVFHKNESVDLYLNGIPIFYGNSYRTFSLNNVTNAVEFSTGETAQVGSGKINGMVEMRDSVLPDYLDQFDQFAFYLIRNVNNLHRNGYTVDGTPGEDFFSGSDAASIEVSITDAEKIAVSLSSVTSDTAINITQKSIYSTSGINVVGQTINIMDTIANQTTLGNFAIPPDPGPVPPGTGTFQVNGETFNWNTGQSINDILTAINASPDVEAIASWDATAQRIRITRYPGNNDNIQVEDFQGNFTSFTYLATAENDYQTISGNSTIAGQAANFSVPPASSGTIRINGVDFNWDDTMSLQNIIDSINQSADAGVVASFNSNLQKIELTRDPRVNFPSSFYQSSRGVNKNEKTVDGVTMPIQDEAASFRVTPAPNGQFTITGTGSAVINWDAGADSVQDLATAINAAGVGVNATWDAASQKFSITSTGTVNIKITDTSGNFTQFLDLRSMGSGADISVADVSGNFASFTKIIPSGYESSSNLNVSGTAIDGTLPVTGQASSFMIPPTGTGTIQINGASGLPPWTINWDAGVDSLQAIATRINTTTGGGVAASWDAATQKMLIQKGTETGFSLFDTAGNFTDFTSLTTSDLNKNNVGSTENALYLSRLWYAKTVYGSNTSNGPVMTVNEVYLSLSNLVANDTGTNKLQNENKKSLVMNIDAQRKGESAVSLDEELISMMRFQQAYAASSKLLTVIDDMLDRLINRTGIGA